MGFASLVRSFGVSLLAFAVGAQTPSNKGTWVKLDTTRVNLSRVVRVDFVSPDTSASTWGPPAVLVVSVGPHGGYGVIAQSTSTAEIEAVTRIVTSQPNWVLFHSQLKIDQIPDMRNVGRGPVVDDEWINLDGVTRVVDEKDGTVEHLFTDGGDLLTTDNQEAMAHIKRYIALK